MKKYLLYALCLCSLFCLSGCKEEDIFSRLPAYQGETVTPWGTQVQDPEPDNPYPLYIFPALDASQPDLAFHLTTPAAFSSAEEFTAAPGYSNRLIVAAIYSLQACTGCREQAPYFDRLAEEFANTQAEFVILFTDRDQEAVSQLPWVKEIKHAKVYYNAYDFCQQEACPIPTQPNAPFITWIADSKNQAYTKNFPTETTKSDVREQIYQMYVQQTQQLSGAVSSNGITVQVDNHQNEYIFNFAF